MRRTAEPAGTLYLRGREPVAPRAGRGPSVPRRAEQRGGVPWHAGTVARTDKDARVTLVLPVTGMTCRSCEARVERAVGKLPRVAAVTASSVRGVVEVTCDGPPDECAVTEAVAGSGYAVGRAPWLSHDRAAWRTAAVALVLVVLLVIVAGSLGWSRLSSGVGDLAAGGLVVVFLLGLAAGVSTCMALTGGLVLAVSAAHRARLDREHPGADPGARERLRPVVVFNLGRVVGFAALGAVLGAVGASITIPTWLLAAMMLTVGVVMGVLGVRLTELSPRMAGWSVTLPSSSSRRLALDRRAEHGYSDVRTGLLGAATFFLPCGFTQAAQVFALSTGSPAYAAAIMGAFALGTAPGLLTLGGLPEVLPTRSRTTMLRGLGVLVLMFAVVNVAAGLRLAGVDPAHPFGQPPVSATATSNVDVTPTRQTLHTRQVADGYLPVRSVVYAGTPVRWVIDSADPQSCAVELRAPSVGVSLRLTKGENTVDIPAQDPGTIAFSCSMGMYGGTISVVPAPPPASLP